MAIGVLGAPFSAMSTGLPKLRLRHMDRKENEIRKLSHFGDKPQLFYVTEDHSAPSCRLTSVLYNPNFIWLSEGQRGIHCPLEAVFT